MVQYEGPELNRVDPILAPGEKEVIALFHNESSFHANEFKQSAWYVLHLLNKTKNSYHAP
jgi:hypothetical protein